MRLALAALAALSIAIPAFAADMNVVVPTITAEPGDTVFVSLYCEPSPDFFTDTYSLEYRLKLGSSVVQSAAVMPEGFLYTWGTPYVNAGPDSVLAAAAGPSDITSGTLMSTVRLIIKPSAVAGTDLPLTFTRLLFNEGNPSVSFTPGVLKIRTNGVGVPLPSASGLALAPPRPNPTRERARIAYRLPPGVGEARLELVGLDGRRVRSEALHAENGDASWSLTDAAGHPLPAGLYFVRLTAGRDQRVQRLIVMP